MIALYDFRPRYCPNCGYKIGLLKAVDYLYTCDCGVLFQGADTTVLLAVARQSDGDMNHWWLHRPSSYKVALYDFIPRYCPNCGEKTGLHKGDKVASRYSFHTIPNYLKKKAFTCGCGMLYQRADTTALMNAAKQTDHDMKDW